MVAKDKDKTCHPSAWFRTIVTITRFVAVGLLCGLDTVGIRVFVFVKGNLEYLASPPFPLSEKKLLVIEGLTGPFATALTTGNIFAAVYVILTYRRQLVYIGLLDLAASAALLWTAVVQSGYIGLTKGQCASGSGADGEPLLYIQRARDVIAENQLYGYDPCEVYLQLFYVRIGTIFFYIITAFTLIIGGGLGMRKHRMNKRGGPRISILRWLLGLPFIIAYYILIDIVKVCLDLYLSRKELKQPEVQIRTKQWRTFRKWTSVKAAAILDMPNPVVILWKKAMQRRMRWRTASTTRPYQGLIRALQDERVVSGIAGHLHHVELVSLSLSCRAVRDSLFLYPGARREKLRERTCPPVTYYERVKTRLWNRKDEAVVENKGIEDGETSECWGCGIRVCRTCSTTRKIRGTPVSHHMALCGAQCGKCFAAGLKYIARCRCKDRRRRLFDTSTEPPSDSYYLRGVWFDRDLCRDCSKETTGTLLEWREKRDRHDHREAVRKSLDCITCGESIQNDATPLWWVCKSCKFECRSLEHPWGRGASA